MMWLLFDLLLLKSCRLQFFCCFFFPSPDSFRAIFPLWVLCISSAGWKAASWLLPMHREHRRQLLNCTQCIAMQIRLDCHYCCVHGLKMGAENSQFQLGEVCHFLFFLLIVLGFFYIIDMFELTLNFSISQIHLAAVLHVKGLVCSIIPSIFPCLYGHVVAITLSSVELMNMSVFFRTSVIYLSVIEILLAGKRFPALIPDPGRDERMAGKCVPDTVRNEGLTPSRVQCNHKCICGWGLGEKEGMALA